MPSTTIELAHEPIALAWNLQGDPARASFVAQAERAFRLALPLRPNTTSGNAETTLFWLGPTSWLWTATEDGAAGTFEARRELLNAHGGALFDVTASRVAYTLRGAGTERLIAKHCPLDLDRRVFVEGNCAQSLVGRVNALIYKRDDAPTFVVMVARSFSRAVWHALGASAHEK